ncbi:MAG: TAXI family TRAP transporter solute-binding subunit [Chloroflexia bacterium]|nr:TAXI family TRAP transporter solute-binding subunit [Chloroflexia bacterium]MDQ3412375.1 TAXI family TRAP transporter solute-binding subunit [Chloroflexota bacterium]
MSWLRRSSGLLVILLLTSMLAVAVPGVLAQDRLSIATGGTGGVYYPYGGGLANLISNEIEGIDVTAEVTPASVDNLLLIESRDADLAFVLADTLYDAAQGTGPFEQAVPVQALAVLYNNVTHIVTSDGAGIDTVADLAGKRVSVGAPGSGTEVIADRILTAAGIDPQSGITREQLGAAESAGAIRDGRIDAYFWSGGLPTASVTDLGATPNFDLKLLPNDDLASALQDEYGEFYGVDTVAGGTYPGHDEETGVIVVPNVLVVHADFDEALAHDILAAMFENQDALILSHPEAENLSLESAVANSPVPFHPGALRYYEEQGVTVGAAATPEG